MKYERTGPQVFVAYPHDEVTIPKIITSCNEHFKRQLKEGMTCDILASEQGPSCKTIDQLPSLTPIHIRFVKKEATYDKYSTFSYLSGITKRPASASASSAAVKNTGSAVCALSVPTFLGVGTGKKELFPKSSPITAMMTLGKAICKTETAPITIEVSRLNIETLKWSFFQSVDFAIEESEFGRGGFRSAFKATTMSPVFLGRQLVIKYYLPETLEAIQSLKETPEIHARKSVQMMALAGNLSSQRRKSLYTQIKKDTFGTTF